MLYIVVFRFQEYFQLDKDPLGVIFANTEESLHAKMIKHIEDSGLNDWVHGWDKFSPSQKLAKFCYFFKSEHCEFPEDVKCIKTSFCENIFITEKYYDENKIHYFSFLKKEKYFEFFVDEGEPFDEYDFDHLPLINFWRAKSLSSSNDR